MLSYRHAFHAGNHADVLKHIILTRTLAYLIEKNRPLLYVDTHAGAGQYDLRRHIALKTNESDTGVKRLWNAKSPPALLHQYIAALRAYNKGDTLHFYPGSPLFARQLLRPLDRGVCYELHPTDYPSLAHTLKNQRRFQILHADGLTGLRALLPPKERRGLILLDPDYEQDIDYRLIPKTLRDAVERFATGIYLLWYPLIQGAPPTRMLKAIAALDMAKTLRVELTVTKPSLTTRLTGSGMWIINPPWVLETELRAALPWLASQLGGTDAAWYLNSE